MQTLILSGRLPCTRDEASTLGAIQLRLFEIDFQRKCEEEESAKLDEMSERTEKADGEADAGDEADVSKDVTSDDEKSSEGADRPGESPVQYLVANAELKKLKLIEEATEIDSETSSNASTHR